MSMNNDNNFTNTYGTTSVPEGSAPMRPGSEFKTAGQSMQPPILSPSTINRSPVLQPENPYRLASPYTSHAAAPQLNPGTFASATPAPAVAPVEAPGKKKKEKAEKSTSSSGKRRIAAAAVAFCLLGAGLGVCGTVAYGLHWADQVKSDAVAAAKKSAQKDSSKVKSKDSSTVLQGDRDYTVLNTNSVDTSQQHTAAEIYAANVNSTVGVSTSIDYNYYGYKTTAAATGSGFILTEDGYIVTNYHVIEDAKEVKVTTYDNTTYAATIIGYDESNDIAVLKIDAKGLTPVILGDSDKMNVGDDVVAIGNPLGELTFSLTKGCISALNRAVTINGTSMNLIQTDCAINSGNSGGALFNMYGEVIGITNAKYSNNGAADASIESICFAIPINSVRDIIESLVEQGYVEKPYIGVYAETITAQNQSTYNVDEGVGIHDIIPDSPAERAGIKAGDVIIEIDGEKITDMSELKSHINDAGIGGKLKLTIIRNGKEMQIVVDVEANQTS
ncbi:MAG: trypsin-like peptidase domain-containing protein [Clostridiales bacterium]|nr:trypsin-like peptidase domain-containing protein [Clostridiales bacterium]